MPYVRHAALLLAASLLVCLCWGSARRSPGDAANRREILFWHFWGGADREVVENIVRRFNESQESYLVRAVAMPGNNLDLKLFLAVTGGDPPDLVNQDDPIVADWAARNALTPLEEVATPEELAELEQWLLPAARRLGVFDRRRYALCNGLDVRALYYNKTLLDSLGYDPPDTLDQLDALADAATNHDSRGRPTRFGYLPDPRRLWAWGVVFGGDFYDEASGRVTVNESPIVRALEWMVGYRERYGVRDIAAFRQGDQSLPGKTFPLLADRYALVMDGQWRVRDIRAAQAQQRMRKEPVTQYGVCPLPPPANGRRDAGWVNGNFFIIPRGAREAEGAWQFMKFWSGFGGHEAEAAATCLAGGWIPVADAVVHEPSFQRYLATEPLFAEFVRLAGSNNQIPTPAISGAQYLQRTVQQSAATALYVERAAAAKQLLDDANREIQRHLETTAP